eukprot:jgi/Astpho2/5805/Aster-02320
MQHVWVNPGEIPNNGIDDDNNGIIDDVYGAAFVNGMGSNDIQDQQGHGTFVSGVIGAVVNNNLGTAGMVPNVTILPCRFMDASGKHLRVCQFSIYVIELS